MTTNRNPDRPPGLQAGPVQLPGFKTEAASSARRHEVAVCELNGLRQVVSGALNDDAAMRDPELVTAILNGLEVGLQRVISIISAPCDGKNVTGKTKDRSQ